MNLKNNICKTKLLGSVIVLFATLFIITGCKSSDFIDDGNGHKQYKNSNGEFVKDDWVELNNKHYYFDMNGFLVTNQWVQDEYYVNENGVMLSNYWYDDKNGNMYYLGDDGKYVKNAIKDIDNNLYAFDINGNMVKNAPYISEGIGYFFSNDGKADKTEGYKKIGDTYCYVTSDGKLLVNDWKEDEDKWYYFNEMGIMLKNSFVGGTYYVDENGEMVKSREIKIGSDVYIFDSDGHSTMKARRVNKNVTWLVKNPLATSYYTTSIHNDFNVKDESKKIKATFNGKEYDVSMYIDAGGINCKIYFFVDDKIKEMGLKEYEATMTTENGESFKIWFSSLYGDDLSWGVKLNGNKERESIYSRIIDLLCKSEDTKYTITFPNSTLTLKSEICPGNFASKYAPYRDKILW